VHGLIAKEELQDGFSHVLHPEVRPCQFLNHQVQLAKTVQAPLQHLAHEHAHEKPPWIVEAVKTMANI